MPASAADLAWRHDPAAWRRSLPRRDPSQLPFDAAELPRTLPLLPDTNLYILRLQGRLPAQIRALLEQREVLHSAVVLAELAVSAGILDPDDPRTAAQGEALRRMLASIESASLRAASAAAWLEAGMIAGIAARVQLGLAQPKSGLSADAACCQRGRRREFLHDALAFLTAAEIGAAFVTADIAAADLLLRFRPETPVLVFRPV